MKTFKASVLFFLLITSLSSCFEMKGDAITYPVKSIAVVLPKDSGVTMKNIASVFSSRIEERSGANVNIGSEGDLKIELTIDLEIGNDGFKISNGDNGNVRIIGSNHRGVLYGIGKFLRVSGYDEAGFTPGEWRGTSVPEKPVRGMYLATHFYNFYQTAPREEVKRYIEDIALWGINTILVWYDMHHFNGFDDPEAIAFRERLKQFMETAQQLDIKVGFIMVGNEGYANSPLNIRAVPGAWRGGHYISDICPNKTGAIEYIMKTKTEFFDWFQNIKPSYICIWPYDQGGCGSVDCQPWGSNGFVKCAKAISEKVREKFPEAKIILSTWYFDRTEWKDVSSRLKKDSGWVDMILAERSEGEYKGIFGPAPGNLPMVGFPEISMYNTFPWGGFGATPLPEHVQNQWQKNKKELSGGFPYSEGIFDDITKAVYSQLYWNSAVPVEQTLKEYISYEYSPDFVDSILNVIKIIEQNHHMRWWPGKLDGVKLTLDWFPSKGVKPQPDADAELAYNIVKQADAKIPVWARSSWRWRILYIRAMLDAELKANGGSPNKQCINGFKELMKIYHTTEKTDPVVKPPISHM